jgi:FkbM family methyltransferase
MVEVRVLHPEDGEKDRFSLGDFVRVELSAPGLETRILLRQGPILYSEPLRDWGAHASVDLLPECPGRYELTIAWRPAGTSDDGGQVESGRRTVHFVVDSENPEVFLPTRKAIDRQTHLWIPSSWEASMMQVAEKRMLEELAIVVQPSSNVYDIGANLGLYSIALARLAATGTVVCFEANPVCVQYLRANLAENQIDNATIVPIALLDKPGTTPFRINYGNSNLGVSGASTFFDQKSGHVVHVPAKPLDELVSALELPAPDVIKLDVEGAEGNVVSGMKRTLEAARPILILELHGASCALEVGSLLSNLEYVYRLPSSEQILTSVDDVVEVTGDQVFQVFAGPDRAAIELG